MTSRWARLRVVSLAGCSHKRELDPRTEPELVRIAEVGSSSGADPTFTGVVSARVESDLGFRVPGKITKRLVDTGQFVRAGQLLMMIDRTDYGHAITARSETVAAAKAKAVQAAADEARYRGLVKSGAVSASIYDQIKAASDAAQAELAAAKAQEQVPRDEGDYSQLAADADGVVIETLAEPGQVVAAGQRVVKIARSGPREATVNLPETLRPAIGSTAYATLYGSTARVQVRLRQLSNAADPQTRTFEARYVLEGAAANAPLGATVSVHLSSDAGMGLVKQQFFPQSDRPELLVEVTLPQGTSIETTNATSKKVEDWLRQQPEAKIVTAYVGAGAPRFFFSYNPELPNPNFAKIVVLTSSEKDRDRLKCRN